METLLMLVSAALLPIGRANFTPYVEGGQRTTIDQLPYMAAILLVNGDQQSLHCTGTIIDRRFVLTAAHCLTDFHSPASMLLRLGSTFAESGGDLMTVANYYAHPYFGWAHPENSYDIALVVPTEIIELDGAFKMVKPLANFDQNFAPDHRCIIAGYGMTMEKQEDAEPPRLHYVMMKVRKGQMCRMSFGKKFAEKLMICSGYLHVNAGACAGDSGGPLFCSGVLYGVISSNYYYCRTQGGLNLMTKVASISIRAWLQQMTGL